MIIFAVDPGSTSSGVVIVNSRTFEILDSMKIENNLGIISIEVEKYYYKPTPGQFVIEGLTSYGKKVGSEVFDTIEFSGRFQERMEIKYTNWGMNKINRKAVLGHLDDLYGARSNDARIRMLLIERFGKEFTSKLKSDCWASFAVAVTFIDRQKAMKSNKESDRQKGK